MESFSYILQYMDQWPRKNLSSVCNTPFCRTCVPPAWFKQLFQHKTSWAKMPSCWRRRSRQTYTWNQFGGWYLGSHWRVGFTPSITLIPWVQKSRNLGKKSASCDQRSEKPWLQTTSLMTFFSFFICNCPPQVKATNDHQIRRVMVHFNPLFTMLNEIWHCFYHIRQHPHLLPWPS